MDRQLGARHPELSASPLGRADARVAGRFRLERRLGRGAHGEVWEADDVVTGDVVALKLFEGRGEERVRHEIATLRMLRLPGVVELLDEGTHEGRAFLVTERVDGQPFPGSPGVLEGGASWATLGPTVIALLETLSRVHAAGVIHRDLKPDNVLVCASGRPVLLDFGIAKTAPLGRDDESARIVGTPAYLAPEQIRGEAVGPETDLYALGVMLHRALSGRWPHAANDAQGLLRARLGTPATPLRDAAPGVPAEVAALVDAMLAHDVGDRPRSASAALAVLAGASPRSEHDGVARRVEAIAQAGDAIDARSLEALFAGPERVFHLRSDAAAALFARTGGSPDAIAREARAWVRAGVARFDGDALAIEREGIERLASGARLAPEHGRPLDLRTLPPEHADLVAWIATASPHADVELLALLTERPRASIVEDVATLAARGLVVALPGDRVEPLCTQRPRASAQQRRRAHLAVAACLPSGSEARLVHLVAGESDRVAEEAAALARRRYREGRLSRAIAALAEGVLAARWAEANDDEARLLALWLEIAIAEQTTKAIDRVLYEIARSPLGARLAPLEALARAWLAALSRAGERALEIARQVPPFEDLELERVRHVVRVLAARWCALGDEEAIVAEAVAWALATDDPRARATANGWLGRLRYRQGRFEEAASLHVRAAAEEPRLHARLVAQLHAASASMEAFAFEDAADRANAARDLAARCRLPHHEARAEWLVRSIAYRRGRAASPDRELVDLVARLGVADLEALVCLNEAAVAFRAGLRDVAVELATRASRTWDAMGKTEGAWLARSLAVAATGRADADLAARAGDCTVPGIGIQILGLVGARAGAPSDLVARLAATVPRRHWSKRMDVSSVDEALAALDRRGQSTNWS